MPVDIMPGDDDPSSATIPQQPLHTALVQSARTYSTFQSVTNPYWSSIDNVTLLGASGQTIDDIYKYVASEDRLEMAKKTLEWGHMAPTAPDTLCKFSWLLVSVDKTFSRRYSADVAHCVIS